jgi:hypothetical protein
VILWTAELSVVRGWLTSSRKPMVRGVMMTIRPGEPATGVPEKIRREIDARDAAREIVNLEL